MRFLPWQFRSRSREERGSLLAAAAGRPGPVGKRMARLMLGTKSPYPEDVWLDACKRAVDTGDLQRVQMMLDRTLDKVDNPSLSLTGEVLRYAYLQNPAMAGISSAGLHQSRLPLPPSVCSMTPPGPVTCTPSPT